MDPTLLPPGATVIVAGDRPPSAWLVLHRRIATAVRSRSRTASVFRVLVILQPGSQPIGRSAVSRRRMEARHAGRAVGGCDCAAAHRPAGRLTPDLILTRKIGLVLRTRH